MTHETDEDLSALIDGELPAAEAERARAHAASCPQCAERLSRLRGASALFKRSASAAAPAGLAERARVAARPRRSPILKAVALAAAATFLLLAFGVGLKKTMPGLFSQIQGMISGAAGGLGSGDK